MSALPTIREILQGRQAVTVEEAARLLGLGRMSVYRALERGEIPNAGVGHAKRVPAWFLVQRLAPPTEPL